MEAMEAGPMKKAVKTRFAPSVPHANAEQLRRNDADRFNSVDVESANKKNATDITSMDLDTIASILRGYLQSLRRISGNRCDFWSYAIDMDGGIEGSIDSIIADTGGRISVKVPAGYKEVAALLDRYVFSMLNVADEELCNLFAWDIVEYIELCCREKDPVTTPLSRREAKVFEGSSSFHQTLAYLVVPIESRALVIALGTRA